jgi:hypothetical protein
VEGLTAPRFISQRGLSGTRRSRRKKKTEGMAPMPNIQRQLAGPAAAKTQFTK